MRRLARLAGTTVVVVLALPVLPAAAADGPSGSANYGCGGQDVNVTMTLDGPPATVRPGQDVRLGGTVTLGFTTQTTLLTRLGLSSKAGVSSADFGLGASTAGRHDAIGAVAVQGDPTPVGQVMSLDARAVMDDYTVPADATGDLLLTLPPTFSVTLSQNGLVAQRTLDCELADADAVPAITRIPVEPPAAKPTETAGAPSGPAISAPPPAADLGSAPPATAAPGGQSSAATADDSRPVFAAVPPSTRSGGVVIPYWSIALVGLVIPLASVIFAISLRHRMRMMQRADAAVGSGRRP